MAGSIKWFVYTDDQGSDWAIKRDESNTEALNGGTQDMPNPIVAENALPSNITPRYIRYSSATNDVTRKVVALTPTIFSGAAANAPSFVDAVSGQTVYYREAVGERKILPMGIDTGLTDGDAT